MSRGFMSSRVSDIFEDRQKQQQQHTHRRRSSSGGVGGSSSANDAEPSLRLTQDTMEHMQKIVAATATAKEKRKLHEQQLIALGAKAPRYLRGKQPYKMLKGMRAAAQTRQAKQEASDKEAGNMVNKRRKREHQEESLSRGDYVNVVRGDRSGLRRTVGDGSRGFKPTSVGSFRNGVLRLHSRDIAKVTGTGGSGGAKSPSPRSGRYGGGSRDGRDGRGSGSGFRQDRPRSSSNSGAGAPPPHKKPKYN